MAKIALKNIQKAFEKNIVIPNLNLEIEDGSFTVLVGPSGCGKSTTLRMIAGLDQQSGGEIYIGERNVSDLPPGKREVAMVFQNYALYPTMTVKENIEFGLKNKKVPKKEREAIISEICEIVGLTEYLDRKPSHLSGGQRQRVALARAMVKKPKVFLMDEPLSNLDAKLRNQMRTELIQLHKKLGSTFVYVTHDQMEAMSMGDKIVIMNRGEIQQVDTPRNIYYKPANLFTAQFIGTPPMNILSMNDAYIGFRPEKALLSEIKMPGAFTIEGRIITREILGAETIYQVQSHLGTLMVKSFEEIFEEDEKIHISVQEEDLYSFDSEGVRMTLEHQADMEEILVGGAS